MRFFLTAVFLAAAFTAGAQAEAGVEAAGGKQELGQHACFPCSTLAEAVCRDYRVPCHALLTYSLWHEHVSPAAKRCGKLNRGRPCPDRRECCNRYVSAAASTAILSSAESQE